MKQLFKPRGEMQVSHAEVAILGFTLCVIVVNVLRTLL